MEVGLEGTVPTSRGVGQEEALGTLPTVLLSFPPITDPSGHTGSLLNQAVTLF